MICLVRLIILAVLTKSEILQRSAATIRDDLIQLDGDYKTIQQRALGINSSATSYAQLYNAIQTTDTITNRTTSDVNLETTWTVTDAQSLISYINNTLELDIRSAMQAMGAKRSTFASKGFNPVYDSQLKQLRNDTAKLGSAMVSKSPSSKKAAFQQVFQKINSDFNPALGVSSSRLSVEPRNAATVKADLQTLNTDCNSLLASINAYNGNISSAVGVLSEMDQLDRQIQQTTTDISNSSSLTAADASTIINYLNDPIEPCVLKVVNAIIPKKSKFAANGLQNAVENEFVDLKKDTDSLGRSLLVKSSTAQQSAGKAAIAKIEADIQKGIDAFR